jgi:hypothetical protein
MSLGDPRKPWLAENLAEAKKEVKSRPDWMKNIGKPDTKLIDFKALSQKWKNEAARMKREAQHYSGVMNDLIIESAVALDNCAGELDELIIKNEQ